MCERHVFGLVLGFERFAAPAWLRGLELRGVIFILVIVVIRAFMNDGARGWFHNMFVAMVWFYDYNSECDRFAVDFDDACVTVVGICQQPVRTGSATGFPLYPDFILQWQLLDLRNEGAVTLGKSIRYLASGFQLAGFSYSLSHCICADYKRR
jgi:hypothetical protein